MAIRMPRLLALVSQRDGGFHLTCALLWIRDSPVHLSDFDYDLPQKLIAQQPLATRSASRLLDCTGGGLVDRQFRELLDVLRSGDLLVFNDTKVIKARLRATKSTGGRVEVLIERITGMDTATAQVRASHAPSPGASLCFASGASATVQGRADGFFVLHFSQAVLDVLERDGELPLPPYIEHQPDATDAERYQTVLARSEGAVAAPTAGLHFDDQLLADLRERGISIGTLTLHVGAGTFQPVRVNDLAKHVMHSERYRIPDELVRQINQTREIGGRIVAVGTTSVRALESAVGPDDLLRAETGDTRLFITPGYRFRIVDVLVTNFHLPKSTLLMLVSSFAGVEKIRSAYAHAIARGYRFFSYGDAMLLERQ